MVRVLICGDPASDIDFVAKKITSLSKKSGPFAFAILTQLPYLASQTLQIADQVRFPIPTYFASLNEVDPKYLLATNLESVGPAATISLHGLTVVLVAGGYDDPPSHSIPGLPIEIQAAMREAGVMADGFRGVDIFVCPTLPHGVALPTDADSRSSSTLVGYCASILRPRYHFTESLKFTALAPFLTRNAVHATRLVALAAARSSTKERWVYAADITPLREMTPAQLAATRTTPQIPAPYGDDCLHGLKRGGSPAILQCDEIVTKRVKRTSLRGVWTEADAAGKLQHMERGKAARPSSTGAPTDASCWFCLENGKDVHLVMSVGMNFYLAAAKGGIVPQHFLIVSIDHLRHALDPGMTVSMRREIETFKQAVTAYYEHTMDGARPYFYERAVCPQGGLGQMHMHIHCIPIKAAEVSKAGEVAMAVSKKLRVPVEELAPGQDCMARLRAVLQSRNVTAGNVLGKNANESFEYFWGELPNGSRIIQVRDECGGSASGIAAAEEAAGKAMRARTDAGSVPDGDDGGGEGSVGGRTGGDVERASGGGDAEYCAAKEDENEREEHGEEGSAGGREGVGKRDVRSKAASWHPLFFGRKIAAELLGLPRRVDWRSCVGAAPEEHRAMEGLRIGFAAFEKGIPKVNEGG